MKRILDAAHWTTYTAVKKFSLLLRLVNTTKFGHRLQRAEQESVLISSVCAY